MEPAAPAENSDGFTIHPADGDGMLPWLREQPWFGGVLATWGASYLGVVQWELAARDIPEWRIAVIQDAPSEFAHQFMYPGGGFALGNALGWVQIVDRMFRANGGTARQFLGVFTGPKAMRRAVATLPVAEADVALTGRRVRWFQECIRHGPDEPYWQASARENLWPPAHGCRRAIAECSTMPGTLPRCGCPCAADLECRLPPGSLRAGNATVNPVLL
jgi:predicted acyl esterase